VLNRNGDQAYKKPEIFVKSSGATNFEAIITYPDTKLQIQGKYQNITIHGKRCCDEYANGNPDKYNEKKQDITTSESTKSS